VSKTDTAVVDRKANMPEVITAPVVQTATVSVPEFGNGSYSSLMLECYKDSMRIFKLDSKQAEKFARQVATELGAIRAQGKVEISFGRETKDGKITIYDFSKVKGVTITNTLTAVKALAYANQAGKNGFSSGKTQWAIMPESELENYLLNL
jgi:hypothetical protein